MSARSCDVETSGEVRVYRLEWHRTEHHGRERVICIGPRAQDIGPRGQDVLRSYLLRPKDSNCFVPVESDRKRPAFRDVDGSGRTGVFVSGSPVAARAYHDRTVLLKNLTKVFEDDANG